MKTKLLLSFLLSFYFCLLSSQVPQGFNYQAIARDVSGNPITGQLLPVRITIQSDSLGGTTFWIEEHLSVSTNSFGLFTLILGKGERKTGSTAATFNDIDWSVTPKYIKTEIDYSGWKNMGSSRLWAVPYSMVAGELGGSLDKLKVKGQTTENDSALFEVKNNHGQTVFAVYNEGVRVYVDDGVGKSSTKGGFAIGGFETAKTPGQEFFRVTRDSTRVYVNQAAKSSTKGGFAIGGFDQVKGVLPQRYFYINNDSIRMYIDNSASKSSTKGGFAIGGFDQVKTGNANFFDISTISTGIINPPQNRVVWYPVKNAFLAGRVLIEKPDSVGLNSFATGYESKAKGQYSQALGYQAIARGLYSTSIGYQSVAQKDNSFAFGQWAQARNQESYAFGRGAIAEGFRSFAFGSSGVDSAGITTGVAYAKGNYSFAIGQGSQSLATGAFALGLANNANGDYSLAMGNENRADGWGATAMGYHTNAMGSISTTMGLNTTAFGQYSTAIGSSTVAQGPNSLAMGYGTYAGGANSIAMGYLANTSGANSIAMGNETQTGGENAVAMGFQSYSTDNSTAMGYQTSASGIYSTAMGYKTQASGIGSTTMGYLSTATKDYSTAMGYRTMATKDYSTVMGYQTIASGLGSTALGYNTSATQDYSTAIGYQTTANEYYSTAMGSSTIACGVVSTALGNGTKASGYYSTSMGFLTTAKPFASVAIGKFNDTICSALGQTNWQSTDPLFVAGNGNYGALSNALTLYKNGNLVIAGTLTQSSDIRLKEDISPISNGFNLIENINPVYFYFKDRKTHPADRQIGFIAQEVKEVLPELVQEDGQGFLSVDYSKISVVLLQAMKEQQHQIVSQQQQIESTKQENHKLRAELDELKSLVNNLIANQTGQGGR